MPEKKVKQIALFGSFHGNNKGDEAIAFAEILFLRKFWPDAQFNIASAKPNYFNNQYSNDNIRAVNVFDLKKVFSTISKADLCIIGGGGLFFEPKPLHTLNIKKNQSLVWPSLAKYAAHCNTPTIFLCIGAEPINSKFAKFIIRNGLNSASAIIVRDEKTKVQLQNFGIKKNIITMFDAAWLLSDNVEPRKHERSDKYTISISPHFGIQIIENHDYADQFRQQLATSLLSFANSIEQNLQWQFLPLHPKDIIECEIIRDTMGVEADIIKTTDLTPLQIINQIQQVDMQIGMRMHGTILSVLANTPFVSITYANKSKQTIKHIISKSDINASDVSLPYSNVKEINQKMTYVFQNKDKIIQAEQQFLKNIREVDIPKLEKTIQQAVPDLF